MTAARSDKKIFALICLVLALGTAALYWPVTSHPFILYDDEQYVTGNPHVLTGLGWDNFVWAFKSGEAANWHPFTWLSHQLDCALFGLDAGAHHFVSLLLHIANTLLLLVFLRGATGALGRSALVAALFAWHPLHVESVAWASERKDVLSTFFFLLTLIAYVRFANLSKVQSPKAKVFYALALLFFASGLMSKPMVVTLPFVLLLLDFWPLGRIQNDQLKTKNCLPLLIEKTPFLLLAGIGSAVTYLVQNGAGAVWATPWPERLANIAISYARYVIKFFCPADLAIIYSHPEHWPVLDLIGALALLLAGTIPILLNWRRHPFLACGWLWFLGALVPAIGLVQVGAQSMADRYSYIPSIGFFIVVVWGGWEFFSTRPRGKNIFGLLAAGALLGCWLATPLQISFWRDNVTLFRHALEVSPDNYVAANCLGKAYEKIGDTPHALVLYRAAVAAAPRFPQSQFNYAVLLLQFGDRPEALKHLQAAAALEVLDADIQFALGQLFAQQGSWGAALNCFSNSVAVQPASAPAQFNFGAALANNGDATNALAHFRAALRLQSDFPQASNEVRRLQALEGNRP